MYRIELPCSLELHGCLPRHSAIPRRAFLTESAAVSSGSDDVEHNLEFSSQQIFENFLFIILVS